MDVSMSNNVDSSSGSAKPNDEGQDQKLVCAFDDQCWACQLEEDGNLIEEFETKSDYLDGTIKYTLLMIIVGIYTSVMHTTSFGKIGLILAEHAWSG